jgi:HK97 gp10 family phage protein
MADNKFANRTRALRRLKALPQSVIDATAKALEASAEGIRLQIQAAAPIDDGNLRDSVRRVDISDESRLAQQVSAGDEAVFYARMVEFGTPRQGAQPFFYPTYRANRKRVRARISRAINKAAKVAVGKP